MSSNVQQGWDVQPLSSIPCSYLQTWLRDNVLLEHQSFPAANELTELFHTSHPNAEHKFIVQHAQEEQDDYYENIIAHKKQIPTRPDNWHDFLNALVWMQFPKAKTKISELHAKDIADHGLVPRTPRRDRLTHFDECGVLLLVKQRDLVKVQPFFLALCTHRWMEVFQENAGLWHSAVKPCLFGHATMEMLLSPFIGLTAKWLALVVEDNFDEMTSFEQRQHIDERLAAALDKYQGFISKNVLRPLPILGIPSWYSNQTESFYSDGNYFRAQRAGVILSEQYPLTVD